MSPVYQESFDTARYYYIVGDKKTFSKAQAFIWADGKNSEVGFYCMDKVNDIVDWTKEPVEDITELLAQRAKRIRGTYNFVSLQYSGGYDSQTVLDAFLHNGLLLDEVIVIKKTYLANDHWQNLESDVAISQANMYKKLVWPNLKITLVELGFEHTRDFFLKHKNNWTEHAGHDLWFTRMSRQHLYNYHRDLQEMVNAPSRVILEGKEKPRLWIENGCWYSTMTDAAIWDTNSMSVPFYFSHHLPELNLKQVWGMIHWLESFPFTSHEEVHTWLHRVQSHKTNIDIYRDWNYSLGRSPVHNNYSYNPMPLKGRWSGDPRLVEESKILSKHFENTQVLEYYNQGVSEYFDTFGESVLDPHKWNVWSKKYYIKPVEPGKNHKKENIV